MISVIHALVAVVDLFVISVMIRLFNAEDTWHIGKEIGFILVLLLLVGISQFLIRDIVYDNPSNWSFGYFFEEIKNAYLVGILFFLILLPLNFTRLNNRHIKNAQRINALSNFSKSDKPSEVFIETKLKSESLRFDITNFLFARADGNYIEIFIDQHGLVTKNILRMTIKDLESDLDSFSNIVKTHRSYIVNINHINEVSGNAQGYKLTIKHSDQVVPVSRAMIHHFNTLIKR
ncbi:LytR/AlgR family response regulator transcription factor [Fulvivirga ligni]|uniref:LytR/AlgR family response regulator transcription factor n=1 Tax=Fulvivirga ligni TaxID=2904246 RepID=UPI001F293393|nr:LytTR family DNA-binding domain-containing protein [Fulvivirga ligni]UII19609.1 LytTR family transcriptional regulator [Fulvivirga ligni]